MMGFLEFFHTNFPGEGGQRDEKFTVFLSQEMECTFSLALPIHGKKKPQTNKQNTKTQNRKIPLSSVFISIAFCSSFRWTHGSLTNSGRSSAPTNTPQKHEKGDKRHLSVFIGDMAIYFLLFFTQRKTVPLFSAAVLSSAKQKKNRWKVSYVLPGFHFSFLASPLL